MELYIVIAIGMSLLCVATASDTRDEDLASTVKFLQEQVSALLDHRQEDYNALEESLKQSMEKNTELLLLRNEVKLMRKELSSLRSSDSTATSAINDRLRLRWLGSAVAELKNEVAEMLRSRNASEELAERSRLMSEIELLRADVADVGRGLRDFGGRLARLEASLGSVRLDVAAVKRNTGQLSRSCADFASQLNAMQLEAKTSENNNNEISSSSSSNDNAEEHRKRHSYSRLPSAVQRLDERVSKLEHKIGQVSRKRALLEKRVVYEDRENVARRLRVLEAIGRDLTLRVRNASEEARASAKFGESLLTTCESSFEALEGRLIANQSDNKRQIGELQVSAARRAAELSRTRDELASLKRAVQALSVSASKLQEKSDAQQAALSRLNETLLRQESSSSSSSSSSANLLNGSMISKAENLTRELERVEDEYRMMVDSLPGNCEKKDGLTLLAPGPGAPLLAACRKGWIVVGRRVDGTVDFDRSWNDYAVGFGSPMNEFWAGNEALHRLSSDNCTRLRIELTDIDGNYWLANYEDFYVDSEESGYRLRVGGYSGNASDAMAYQNGMRFSAKDRDLDISSTDCAANYHGGWWFSHCQHANLNGRYSLGLTWYRSDSNEWMAVANTEISLQRKQQCL